MSKDNITYELRFGDHTKRYVFDLNKVIPTMTDLITTLNGDKSIQDHLSKLSDEKLADQLNHSLGMLYPIPHTKSSRVFFHLTLQEYNRRLEAKGQTLNRKQVIFLGGKMAVPLVREDGARTTVEVDVDMVQDFVDLINTEYNLELELHEVEFVFGMNNKITGVRAKTTVRAADAKRLAEAVQ
jgi:hypothetical protein